MYHQRSTPSSDWTTNTTEMSIMIEGLETMTDYVFQIRAYTTVGPGPWSNRLPFRTFQQTTLTGPTNVRVRRTAPTELQVSWDPPPYSGIVGYKIYYNMYAVSDMDRWQTVDVSSAYTTHEITGLEPHSVYAVRVRARIGYSDFSEIVIANKI